MDLYQIVKQKRDYMTQLLIESIEQKLNEIVKNEKSINYFINNGLRLSFESNNGIVKNIEFRNNLFGLTNGEYEEFIKTKISNESYVILSIKDKFPNYEFILDFEYKINPLKSYYNYVIITKP